MYDLEAGWGLREPAETDTDNVEEDADMEFSWKVAGITATVEEDTDMKKEAETFPDRLLAVYEAAGSSSSDEHLERLMGCLSEWAAASPKKKTKRRLLRDGR